MAVSIKELALSKDPAAITPPQPPPPAATATIIKMKHEHLQDMYVHICMFMYTNIQIGSANI